MSVKEKESIFAEVYDETYDVNFALHRRLLIYGDKFYATHLAFRVYDDCVLSIMYVYFCQTCETLACNKITS
jgi:hypothetical protein